MEVTTRTPETTGLPWSTERGAPVCPGCPDHAIDEEGRYEVALDGAGLHGDDGHHDALHAVRRTPGFASGPFDLPALPDGLRAIAIIDFLERQTFDRSEARDLAERLLARFPTATVHVWPIGPDLTGRIAEDAYWDGDEAGYLIRSPVGDIAPDAYPMDVGWRHEPERVEEPDGRPMELWRGCLYVDPLDPDLVRYGWADLPGPPQGPR